MQQFLLAFARLQRELSAQLNSLPFWAQVTAVARTMCVPLVALSRGVLRRFPALGRLEWLLEIGALSRRHPVPLAISLLYVFWRGLHPTSLGHIGSDPMIYPFLAAISGFNPFLGLVCGAVFGVGDLIQKLYSPDMFGAEMRGDPDYWSAIGGYAVSYGSTMWMGLVPGVLSRVARQLVRVGLPRLLARRAAAAADGATPGTSPGHPLAEMVAGFVGAYGAAYFSMDQVLPQTEKPAFLWRPNPDTGCHGLEVRTYLQGRAGSVAKVAGVSGALLPTLVPPVGGSEGEGSVAPAQGAKQPEPKSGAFDPTDEERKRRWREDGLVWDARGLQWRLPRPDEYPPPDEPPEKAFLIQALSPYAGQNRRDQTPPQCLERYDAYVTAQGRLRNIHLKTATARDDLRNAQNWLQLKLGLFTAQFAIDMTDFLQLGAAGARMAGPIATAIGKADTLATMMREAAGKAKALVKAGADLLKELGEFGLKVSRLRSLAEVAGYTARYAATKLNELTEAALRLDARVAANRRLLGLADEVDMMVARRGEIVGQLMEAEKRLQAAEAFWARKQRLQTWANGERASITAEQARLSLEARAELEAVREQIRTLEQRVTTSPEMKAAADRTGRATTALAAAKERIRQLEERAKELVERMTNLQKSWEMKQTFLRAEEARDTASALVDKADAELRAIQDEITQLESSPAMKAALAEDARMTVLANEAEELLDERRFLFQQAEREEGQIQVEVGRAVEAGTITPEDARARFLAARQKKAEAKALMEEARNQMRAAQVRAENAREVIRQEREANAAAYRERNFDGRRAAAESEKASAKADLERWQQEYDRAAKELQPYSHPGINYDDYPRFMEELDRTRQQLRSERAALPEYNRAFDEASNIEQQTKSQLISEEMESLNAKQAQAQARRRQAERSWEELAAERDPENFQQWKLEVEGTDPWNEAPAELQRHQQEVLDLRKQEEQIEGKINSHRDALGGQTSGALKEKLLEEEAELQRLRQQRDEAEREANAARAEAEQAEGDARAAELELKERERELQRIKAEQGAAEAEIARLQGEGAPAPDAIDQFVKASHEASEAWKPAPVRSIEEALKGAAGTFGRKWAELFDGQSPEEVAEGIKKSRDKVISLRQELEEMGREADQLHSDLPRLKAQLDDCLAQNANWRGDGSH